MALDQKKMMQAVYDSIYDSLTLPPTNPDGSVMGGPIMDRSQTLLSLAWPVGIPVDSATFANAWSPTNPTGTVFATEVFSRLVDDIPAFSSLYSSSGRSVDALYGQMVKFALVDPAPPVNPDARAEFDRKFNLLFVDGIDYDDQGRQVTVKVDSPGFRNYKAKKSGLEAAQLQYINTFLTFDFSKPDDQRKWSMIGPVLVNKLDLARADFQASRPNLWETALAIVARYAEASPAGMFADAKNNYDLTRRGSLLDPGTFYHRAEAFPGNWFTEDAASSFTQMTIESRSARYNESSSFESWSVGGGASWGLWSVGAGAGGTSTRHDVSTETKNMKISFKLGRIEIRRPWLDISLYSLKGWRVPARPAGAYSTGETNPSNRGEFAVLPTSFIVARDVEISAEWGETDMHFAAETRSGSTSIGWGPFSLSGSYYKSTSNRTFSSNFDGVTIRTPGLQIIGWMSQVLPMSPPLDGGHGLLALDDVRHGNNPFWSRPATANKGNHKAKFQSLEMDAVPPAPEEEEDFAANGSGQKRSRRSK